MLAGRAARPRHHDRADRGNLVYDGERLLFLDWDSAGANDPFYDLAAVAVFLPMDAATSAQLIAAHDQAPVAQLTARFIYCWKQKSLELVVMSRTQAAADPGQYIWSLKCAMPFPPEKM